MVSEKLNIIFTFLTKKENNSNTLFKIDVFLSSVEGFLKLKKAVSGVEGK